MRWILFVVAFFFGVGGVCGQVSIDTAGVYIRDSVRGTVTDWSVYLGAEDTVNAVGLVFDTISLAEFDGYKERYRSQLSPAGSRVAFSDTAFTIRTPRWARTFNTRETDAAPWHYYKGYLKALSLHVVLFVDGRNELAILQLIDDVSGKVYWLGSGYDHPCETPLLSPRDGYLLAYANHVYERNRCMVMVLRVERDGRAGHFRLRRFVVREVFDWDVREVVWIDEEGFALWVEKEVVSVTSGKRSKVRGYLLGQFVW